MLVEIKVERVEVEVMVLDTVAELVLEEGKVKEVLVEVKLDVV